MDLLNPLGFVDGSIFEQMAELPAVTWCPGPPAFWAVLEESCARFVLEHPELFSSAFGTGPAADVELGPTYDRNHPPYHSLNLSDPPVHTTLRNCLQQWLRSRRVDVAKPAPVLFSGEIVESVLRTGPRNILEQLLNLEPAQALELQRVARRVAYANEEPGVPWLQWRKAERELREMLGGIRAGPVLEGRPLDRLYLLRLLVLASLESTTTALANLLLELSPLRWRELRENPAEHAVFVEEVLWKRPPIQRFGRTALQDVTLGEARISRGQRVVVFFTAANRRGASPQRHLAFGAGPHRCPGAHLARRQMRALLEAVLRLPECPQVERVEFYRSSFTLSPRSLVLLPADPQSP